MLSCDDDICKAKSSVAMPHGIRGCHCKYADLGDLATRCCQYNTGTDNLHHLSSWAAKGLELSQGALVQGVQGSLSLLDDRLSSSQVPCALLSKGCDFSLCTSQDVSRAACIV